MAKLNRIKTVRIKTQWKEYCDNSTIHGFRYLTEEGSHWLMKVVWAATILMSFLFCIIMSMVIWSKYVRNPTVTMVETTNYPSSEIKFPAVLVCNSRRVYEPSTGRITDILTKRGFSSSGIEAFYESISYLSWNYQADETVVQIVDVLEKVGITIKELLNEVSQPCESLLVKCWWRSREVQCKDMFRKQLTCQGHCCQFDIDYFRNSTNVLFQPTGYDKFRGLVFELDPGYFTQKRVKKPGSSKVFITSSDRTVTIVDDPEVVVSGIELNIGLQPSVMECSDEVKGLSIETRQCLLVDEVVEGTPYINHGSSSLQSCFNFGFHYEMANKCHCTLSYVKQADPRELWNEYPDCTIHDYECTSTISDEQISSVVSDIGDEYKCYSACDEVYYEYSVDYVRKERLQQQPNGAFSTVNVYISERTCIKYRREVLFSWDQLLASLGGIFGLCLGGSIVSVVELICFFLDVALTAFRSNGDVKPDTAAGSTNVYYLSNNKPLYPRNEFIGTRKLNETEVK